MKKYIITALVLSGCGTSEVPVDVAQQQIAKNVPASTEQVTEVVCADLAEVDVRKGVKFRKCDGSEAVGTYEVEVAAQEMPDLSNLRPEHIKKDVEVAGIMGTYETPSVGLPDLTNLRPEHIKKDVEVAGIMGTYEAPSVDLPDLSDLTSSNILSGVTIAGVTGTVLPKPALCTGDAQVGCVTTNSFKSVVTPDSSKILLGTTIAGIAGTVRVPDVANVRHGTMVGVNLLGTLNASCRSGNAYANGTALETVTDVRGDLDDRYNGCRSITADALSAIDEFSGLRIYNPVNRLSGNYTTAAAFCANLSYNGLSGWRVPTQKELMQLYINGLRYLFTSAENTTFVLSSTKLSTSSNNVWAMYPTTGSSASAYVDNASPSMYFCVR